MCSGYAGYLAMAAWLLAVPARGQEPPAAGPQPGQDTIVHLKNDELTFTLPCGDWYEDEEPGAINQLVRYRRGLYDTFTIIRARSYGAMMDEGKRKLFKNGFKRAPDLEIDSLTCEKVEHHGLPAHQCHLSGTDKGAPTKGTARLFLTSRYSYAVVGETLAPADPGWHLAAIESTRLGDDAQEPGPFSMLIESTGGSLGPLALLGVLIVLVFIFRKDIGHFFRRRRPKDEGAG